MQHNQIMLKNPMPAQKTDFNDYHFCGAFIEKKFVTIKKGQIVAAHWKLAKQNNLETCGEIYQCPKEREKQAAAIEKKRIEDLQISKEAKFAVAIIRKDAEKLNQLLNN